MRQIYRAGLLVAVVLTGCGVTPQDSARQVDPPRGQPAWQSQPLSPDDTGAMRERLYLIRGDEIVPVLRHVPAEPTLDGLMDDLLAGPTEAERKAGLTSALLGDDIITGVHMADNNAVVELAATLGDTSRNDQVLALAQIVLTLTAHPPVTGVSFTSNGQSVAVPVADGSLSTGPLTAADYHALLTDT
jgi:Sporulation and spore germination